MKKVLFTICLAFFLSANAQAQGDFKFGVTGGAVNSNVRAGASLLNIIDLGSIDAINKFGFFVGAAADYGISEKLHIQPELLYTKAGKLGYIQLPIMAKYYIIDDLYAQVGPQFSLSTNADEVKDLLGLINAEDALSSTGVDIAFGAGYELLENLSVQARFATELTNRYNGPANTSLKVRSSNFYLGVVFFL